MNALRDTVIPAGARYDAARGVWICGTQQYAMAEIEAHAAMMSTDRPFAIAPSIIRHVVHSPGGARILAETWTVKMPGHTQECPALSCALAYVDGVRHSEQEEAMRQAP